MSSTKRQSLAHSVLESFFLKKLYIEEYLGGFMRLNFTFTLE